MTTEKDSNSGEDLAQELIAVVEERLAQFAEFQTELTERLADPGLGVFDIPSVVDVGVGSRSLTEPQESGIVPTILVSPNLTPEERDQLPETIDALGETFEVTITELGPAMPTCLAGIPTTQHQSFGNQPPGGVAIAGVDPNGKIPVGKRGSSGVVVQKLDPPNTNYMLTADHVISGLSVAQPWDPSQIIGSFVQSGDPDLDVAIHEIPDPPNPTIHCFGKPKAPETPVVGMKVMKSGAASGVTGSEIVYVTPRRFFIRNEPLVPQSNANQFYNYLESGDSGSVAVIGTGDLDNPDGELGEPIETAIIEAIQSSGALPPDRIEATRISLRRQYRNRVLGVNVKIRTMDIKDRVTIRAADAVPMKPVLKGLGVKILGT